MKRYYGFYKYEWYIIFFVIFGIIFKTMINYL